MDGENTTVCIFSPSGIELSRNDTVSYINNILLVAVNAPCAIFACLSNLAVMVTVAKNPSLQRPSNILLCSLAFTYFLSAVIAQPILIVWRLALLKSKVPCSKQILFFYSYNITYVLTVCLSFLYITITSFDRHYALSKPLVYVTEVTKGGTIKKVTFAGVGWLVLTVLTVFVLPPFMELIIIGICSMLFLFAPPINYVRTWRAIVHHNSQVANNVVSSQQLSAVVHREKKVFRDMLIVTVVLFTSLVPGLVGLIIEHLGYSRVHTIFAPWAWTMSLAFSSINPLIYFAQNENLRNAFKSMVKI